MNVKPGDIAKVIEGTATGAMVYVDRLLQTTIHTTAGKAAPGLGWWYCEALQSLRLHSGKRVDPGKEMLVNDSNLRRMEPPADDSLSDRIRESLGARV